MKLVAAWVTTRPDIHHWARNHGPGHTEPLTLCGYFWLVSDVEPPSRQIMCGNCFRSRAFKGYAPLPVTIDRYGVLV